MNAERALTEIGKIEVLFPNNPKYLIVSAKQGMFPSPRGK